MEFLIQYKELITICVVAFIEIIIFLVFKKKPQIIIEGFVSKLCTWILEAESKFKVGSDKMQYVLSQAKIYLGDKYIENEVRNLVEYLLEMPEKKGKK